jgi:PAS domain S-box-containing protein
VVGAEGPDTVGRGPSFGDFRRLLLLIAIMAAVAASVAIAPLVLLYENAVERERSRVEREARMQALLLDAVVAEALVVAALAGEPPLEAALDRAAAAHRSLAAIAAASSSLMVLSRGQDGAIVVVSAAGRGPAPATDAVVAALGGDAGAILDRSPAGSPVIAGFAPVRQLGLGVVIQAELADIRTRFLRAGIIGGLVSVLVVSGGALLYYSLSQALIDRLRAEQRRQRMLFDHIAAEAEVYETDDGGGTFRLIDRNAIAAAAAGPGPVLGRTLSEVHPEIAATPLPAALHRCWDTGETAELSPYPSRVGSAASWRESTLFRLPNRDVVVLSRDVTEQIAQEARIRESEARYRLLVEQQPLLICQYRADTSLTFVNDSYCRFFGRSREVLLGSRWIDLVTTDLRATVLADLAGITAFNPDIQREGWTRDCHGNRRWLLWHHHAFFDTDARPVSYQSIGTDLTDQRRAQTAMENTAQLLQAVLDHAPALIAIKDLAGTYLTVNQSYREAHGFDGGDPAGRNVFDLYPPPVAERLWRTETQAVAQRQPLQAETTIRHADGALHTYLALVFPLVRDGEPFAVCSICTDITVRKAVEAALHESRSRFRALLDATGDIIVLIDGEGTVLAANRAAEAALAGDGGEPVIGQKLQRLLPAAEAASVPDVVGTVRGERRPLYLDVEAGGRWFDLLFYPVHAEDGGPVTEVACYVRDVSGRRQADALVRTLEQAVHQSPVSVLITDRNGSIAYVNPRFCETMGYAADELIGRNPRMFKSSFTSDEAYAALWQTIAAGRVWRGELRNRRKDGRLLWESVSIAPVRNAAGDICNFVQIAEDVSRQKAIEAQFQRSQQLQALGQLTGGIAHDFNNLLAILVGNLELLAERVPAVDGTEVLIADALATAQRGAEMTRRLLTFARRQPLSPQEVDLNQVLRDLLPLLRRMVGAGISVVERLAPRLCLCRLDVAEFERALINVAVNARDAMGTRGTLTITTDIVGTGGTGGIGGAAGADGLGRQATADHAGDDEAMDPEEAMSGPHVRIGIGDTGSGMPPEVLKQAFHPFFTTKEFGHGAGLGLSMVYGFAKQSGGHVRIASGVGRGTLVEIFLPCADGERTAQTGRPAPEGVVHRSPC